MAPRPTPRGRGGGSPRAARGTPWPAGSPPGSLREGAEAAAEVADVRVVDVPVDDVGDLVADRPHGGDVGAANTRCRSSPGRGAAARARPPPARPRCPAERVAADDERGPTPSSPGAQPSSRPSPSESARASAAPSMRGSSHPRRGTRGRRAAAARARGRATGSPRGAARPRATGPPGLTWSIVTGETPPQSSMPGLEQAREVVGGEVRRRLHVRLRAEHDPRRGDRPEVVVQDGSGCAAIRVPGFARKFWTITSCTCPCTLVQVASASSASSRSSRVSPIPIRIPLVNGIRSSPAAAIVASAGPGPCRARPSAGRRAPRAATRWSPA